jgi:hypothetical protein
MSDLDERAPARRLAELSQKIAKVTTQLEQSGELTSAHQEMARTIHSREIVESEGRRGDAGAQAMAAHNGRIRARLSGLISRIHAMA